MKTQKITLIAALFLNKFDKELQQLMQQDLQIIKTRKNGTSQVAV